MIVRVSQLKLMMVVAFGTAASACSLLVSIDGDLSSGLPEGDSGTTKDADTAFSNDSAPPVDGSGDDGEVIDEDCPSTDQSLEAWFRFDETQGQGTVAKDCSHNQWTATSIGNTAPLFATGHKGNAVDFDGKATCMEVQNTGASGKTAFEGMPFTVAAWVFVRNYTTGNSTGRFLVSHVNVNGWHFGTDDPDFAELDFDFGDGGKLQINKTIPRNAWTHIAAVYNPAGNTGLFFVNGVFASSKSNVPLAFNSTFDTAFRIGCRSPTGNIFDGLVDDLRIYSRALTNTEVATIATQ